MICSREQYQCEFYVQNGPKLGAGHTVAKKFKYETSENPVDRAHHFADETEYRRKMVLSREKEEDLM